MQSARAAALPPSGPASERHSVKLRARHRWRTGDSVRSAFVGSSERRPRSQSSLPSRPRQVVTDLVRAAQFHRATDVWVPVVPPLSMYQKLGHSGAALRWTVMICKVGRLCFSSGQISLYPQAIALRPELWRVVPRKLELNIHVADAATVICPRCFLGVGSEHIPGALRLRGRG